MGFFIGLIVGIVIGWMIFERPQWVTNLIEKIKLKLGW